MKLMRKQKLRRKANVMRKQRLCVNNNLMRKKGLKRKVVCLCVNYVYA